MDALGATSVAARERPVTADESAPALAPAAVVTLNLTSSVAVGHDPVPGTVSRIVALPVTHTCGVKLPLAGVIVATPLTTDQLGVPPEPLPCATKQYCPFAPHAFESAPALAMGAGFTVSVTVSDVAGGPHGPLTTTS